MDFNLELTQASSAFGKMDRPYFLAWAFGMFGEPQAALAAAILFFAAGIAASLVPVIPGTAIAWVGILVHKLWLYDQSVSWSFVAVATFLMILS